MDGYNLHRFADGSEYKVRRLVLDTSIPEDPAAATYSERIARRSVPLEVALAADAIGFDDWLLQREEEAMSAYYGCPVKTTIL